MNLAIAEKVTFQPSFIGSHPLIQKINAVVERVANTDTTVLITGESGTGKELIARTLHNQSARNTRPFVPVNCAAIPGDLLESELFGHARGAFTGALAARAGLFQLADGGTIFLDEVGEMPAALQAKLLRVLQNGEMRAIGEDRPRKIDVRIIAATNKDLREEVRKGSFREDLFYRLQVIPVHLPPLRARRSDIPRLVDHFLQKSNRKYGLSVTLSSEAMVYLWEYDWPGNVRELENLIERLVILDANGEIRPEDLSPYTRALPSEPPVSQGRHKERWLDLKAAVEQFEYRLIDRALARANGNRTAAAQMLGLKRTTLVAKLRLRNLKG
jgi:transcriptional regulator with GAF, ATPase, and Fis domain